MPKRRLEGQVRADLADGLQQPPLRALGQGATGHGRQALGRPGRLPAHQGDGPAVTGPVQERPGRVPPQGRAGHRRAAGMAAATSSRSCWRSSFSVPTRSGSRAATEPTDRPFTGYFGPKVVLQNWRSASNAEMFPAGFRALGLGKVIGTPTMGAVIGTGSYSLIDGSTIRTPGVGVFLADSAPDQHGKPRASSPTSTSRIPPRTTSPAATASSKWRSRR